MFTTLRSKLFFFITLTMLVHFNESASHAISYSVAMIVNFLMQKRFIFENNRKTGHAFMLSVLFSVIGWMLSQLLFNILIHYTAFFKTYDILAKILVTGSIFLYNFYTKRFSFEKRVPWK